MEGWIKLHRKVLFSDMYRSLNSRQRDVMITCLLLANHSEKQWEFDGKIYECKPGQFITSLQKIADFCGSTVKVQSVRTALLKLEKWGFLTNKSTKQNRLITICKWDTYQQKEKDTNKEPNSQSTDDKQTSNKEPTTNKNDINNDIEEKEENSDPDFSDLNDGKKLNQNPEPDSEQVQKATKSLADFFSISQSTQPKPYSSIANFCRYMESSGKFDHFRKQFAGYVKSKPDGQYLHSWYNYIGKPEESYEDGAWNKQTWFKEGNKTISMPKRRNRNPQ